MTSYLIAAVVCFAFALFCHLEHRARMRQRRQRIIRLSTSSMLLLLAPTGAAPTAPAFSPDAVGNAIVAVLLIGCAAALLAGLLSLWPTVQDLYWRYQNEREMRARRQPRPDKRTK